MNHSAVLRLFHEYASRLDEGGAAGHLQHLYDNLGLTFGEIKDVITSAAEGRLEKVSEKLDGMNLVFTYDCENTALKVARTGTDIKKGGMDAAALSKKFYGRGNIEVAFNEAFVVLTQALSSLQIDEQERIFGSNGRRWYSMEVIYSAEPNTINYDSNNIVFHGWPIFEIDESGDVEQSNDDSGVDVLTTKIEQMQKAVTTREWRVRGPTLLNMQKISDGSVVTAALAEIDGAMAQAGVNDSDTVYDYLRNMMQEEIGALNLAPDVAKMVVERVIGAPGAPGVPEIKRHLSKDMQQVMADFVRASDALKSKFMAPIEGAIHRFTIEVLRGLNSTLVASSDKEVARLRAQVTAAINAIQRSNNQVAMDVLHREMQRLGNVDNLSAAMEGIVFFYKGQAYKFTGAFAPAHQILGLFKYGRKGVPKSSLGESTRLTEGGGAFDGVNDITTAEFAVTWPRIRDDLRTLGCTKIEPIGSTGKKPMMGDVDVAVEFSGDRDELFDRAKDLFGKASVLKVGSNIVTVKYPVYVRGGGLTGSYVQVDMMLGKVQYLKWSRFGTSTDPQHPDYSLAKGVVRNLLINVVSRVVSGIVFPGKQSELDRVRYVVDFDRGLFKVTQTRRGKTNREQPVQTWRTLERKLVSDDPDVVVSTLFGDKTKNADLRRFEDVLQALRRSSNTRGLAVQIEQEFLKDLHEYVKKTPTGLGANPQDVIDYVERVVARDR